MTTAITHPLGTSTLPPVNTGIARQISCLVDALTADLGGGFRLFDGTADQARGEIREFLRRGILSGAFGRFYMTPMGDSVAVDVVCRALQTGARLAILAAEQPDADHRLALVDTEDAENLDTHHWPVEEVGGAY